MHHFMTWRRHGMGGQGGDALWRRAPTAFSTTQEIFYREAVPGDVVWLLTSMKYKGHIVEPALMGRLRIVNVRRQGHHSRQAILLPAIDDGFYFPMNNSFDLLKELRFVGKTETFDPDHCSHCQNWKRRGKLYSGIGMHFRRSRKLADESHERVEAYMREVLSKKPIFISYRWSDNPLFALSLGEALIGRGLVVWWDQWMVSTLTFRQQGAPIPPQLLQETLDDGIRQSSLFVALVTNTYAKSQWTLEEFNLAIRHKPETHIIAVDMGGSLPRTDKRIQHERASEPEALAQRLADLLVATAL